MNNLDFTIVSSNCTGGFIYHWLGLKFNSPFINLWLTPCDFVKMLENFEEFLKCDIAEDTQSGITYPIGKSVNDIKIYFQHYSTYKEAYSKWNERKQRMNCQNMCIFFSNWNGDYELLKRFDKLPFKYKVVFTDKPYDEIRSAYHLKGYDKTKGNVYATQYISGKRYIDQFDYVSFFNSMVEEKYGK